MADEEVVAKTNSTVSEVTTTISPSTTESSADIKAKLTTTEEPKQTPTKAVENATKSKSPLRETDSRSSDEIRKQIEQSKRAGDVNADSKTSGVKDVVNAQEKNEVEDKSKWFDPEKGFKTAEDMKKSYAELQDSFRKKSEEVKADRSKLEIEKAQIQEASERLKTIESKRELTPEEAQQQEAIKEWKVQNKEALDLIKDTIKKDLAAEKQAEKVQEANSSIQQQVLKERQDWLENFNKDTQRKQLWPTMEKVFKDHGDTLESAVKNFAKNPLPIYEAVAIQKELPSIIERARAEAVEQYKAQVKEAAEVERKTKFALPGGPKSGTGDVDISKLSSFELGSLLQRNENG